MKPLPLPIGIIITLLAISAMVAADLPGPPDNPEKLEASSTLKDNFNRYDVSHLTDGTWASWCEGDSGDGTGSKIKITYNWTVKIDALYIKNGFGLRKYFGLNNRAKKINITGDGVSSRVISLADRPEIQKFAFSPPLTGKSFTFEIQEIYRGSKFNDTCIAEMAFKPVSIQDTDEMPRFRSLTFMMPAGPYGGGSIITLLADGGVRGEHACGHQCGTSIVSGTWKKIPDGTVRIDYVWADPVNCGEMEGEIKTVNRKASLVLKRFGIDGIINSNGTRAKDIRWE